MPKTIVVNSTPIIALSSIDKLYLLKDIYSQIIIPDSVRAEIEVKNNSKAQKYINLCSDWILVKQIKNTAQKQTFKPQLHDGEVEVMILGQELNADLLIIDDYMARKYAKYLEFDVIGTVGVLLDAKSKKHIEHIKPLLDELIFNGIYISNGLYYEILKIADEI